MRCGWESRPTHRLSNVWAMNQNQECPTTSMRMPDPKLPSMFVLMQQQNVSRRWLLGKQGSIISFPPRLSAVAIVQRWDGGRYWVVGVKLNATVIRTVYCSDLVFERILAKTVEEEVIDAIQIGGGSG